MCVIVPSVGFRASLMVMCIFPIRVHYLIGVGLCIINIMCVIVPGASFRAVLMAMRVIPIRVQPSIQMRMHIFSMIRRVFMTVIFVMRGVCLQCRIKKERSRVVVSVQVLVFCSSSWCKVGCGYERRL